MTTTDKDMDPVAVVERQLVAYNAHDLEAFLACYTEDIEIVRLPDREPSMKGLKALAEFYRTERFNLPDLRYDVVNRIVLGNKVIDHEKIRGLRRGQVVEVVAVFEVVNGLISAVWFHSSA